MGRIEINKSNNMVGVSIVIPVYNGEAYLRKCLNSVINQTFQNLEIVIINDGSNDHSDDIVKDFLVDYSSKIKYVIKENGGLASSLNKGLAEANGKYVIFLDSDDYLAEDCIEKLYRVAEEYQSDMVVSGQYKIKPDGTIVDQILYRPDSKGNSLLRRLNLHGKIYLRSYLLEQDLSFPDGKTYEDNSFNLVAYFLAKNLRFIEYVGYYQLVHEGTITSKKIHYDSFPIEALNQAVDYVEQNIDLVQDEKLFEFTVLSFFAYFIFVRNKRKEYLDNKDAQSDIQEVLKICEDFTNITTKYFSNFIRNKYFNLFKYRQLGIRQKLGTFVFAVLVKTNMLKPFVKIYYFF